MKRILGSERTRQSLSDLIEGRLSSADGRAELVKLATRLIVEESLEAESRDALGRDDEMPCRFRECLFPLVAALSWGRASSWRGRVPSQKIKDGVGKKVGLAYGHGWSSTEASRG